jgi:hypothetical protein
MLGLIFGMNAWTAAEHRFDSINLEWGFATPDCYIAFALSCGLLANDR